MIGRFVGVHGYFNGVTPAQSGSQQTDEDGEVGTCTAKASVRSGGLVEGKVRTEEQDGGQRKRPHLIWVELSAPQKTDGRARNL